MIEFLTHAAILILANRSLGQLLLKNCQSLCISLLGTTIGIVRYTAHIFLFLPDIEHDYFYWYFLGISECTANCPIVCKLITVLTYLADIKCIARLCSGKDKLEFAIRTACHRCMDSTQTDGSTAKIDNLLARTLCRANNSVLRLGMYGRWKKQQTCQ